MANLVSTAQRSEDGKHYIANGSKKWITNGVYADYFVTAVRTGGKGMGGLSLMVVERTEGLTTRKMDCMGVLASGTTFVTYEDVKVPVGNLLGKENKGFQIIMSKCVGRECTCACTERANPLSPASMASEVVSRCRRTASRVSASKSPSVRSFSCVLSAATLTRCP